MHSSYETILLQRFQENETLLHFEGYKDTILISTQRMVSSYIGHPILHAHLIWNHFTAAFSINGTLFDLEGYKDIISNKYKKLKGQFYIGHPIVHAHLFETILLQHFEIWGH